MKNKSVLTNLIWRFAERCGAQGVSFVVSIVLARLLAPELYGTISLVTVFTTIMQVFVDSGMGNALIQKKDADDLDFSSVFYFNVVVCAVLYLVMFCAAPVIARFYEDMSLVPIIRVLSLTLVISGVKNVQQAYVSRTMQFKRFFFATLGGTVGAAVIGIGMAYAGYGVWALVAQQLFNAAMDTVVLWVTVKWRPKRMFSWKRLKSLLSFGSKLLASSLLDTVYNNLRQLIIGKVYSTEDLAYYNKGQQFPNIVITNINSSIDSVLLPVMSAEQDDIPRVKQMTRKAIRTSSFVIWPMVIGMAACAEPLIEVLLTEKWLPCVPFLRVFCITYGFWPIHTANLNAIKAVGRSDIFLKLEIVKKAVGLLSIVVSVSLGVHAIAIAMLITAPISAMINAFPNRKLLGYRYREQLKDILPSLLLSLVMGAVVYAMSWLPWSRLMVLAAQVLTGVLIYVVGARALKLEQLQLILGILKRGKQDHAA